MKLIAGVTVAVVIIAAVLVIVSNLPAFSSSVLGPVVNPPKPQVTMVNGQDTFDGLDYVFKVDVNVRNNGGAGTIEVFAEINGAGRYEQKSQKIHLDEGATQSLHFVFDISVWGSLGQPSINYKAWAQTA
jgi:hypothetical protein